MDFIYGDDVRKRKPVKLDIPIKHIHDMRIRDMKSVCDRDRGSREISVGRDDEHVSCIGTAPALVNELKGFVGFVGAVRICTPPTSLFQYQDKLIMILKNRGVMVLVLIPRECILNPQDGQK